MRRIACIGGGTIGSGWAAFFLSRGVDVVAADPGSGAEAALRKAVADAWPVLEKVGLADGASVDRLTFVGSVAEAVADADFVQESVPDRLELKVQVFEEMDRHARPETILASSSSKFLPKEFSRNCAHPQRCIVGHPFAPTYLIPLVELLGAPSADDYVEKAKAFYEGMGKQTITLKREVPGYIANRLQWAVIDEANKLVEDGICEYADIDKALTESVGLRWAFMGISLYYHLGGGQGGLTHCLAQFGWRGKDASRVSLEANVDSVAQSFTIDQLAQWRDENLAEVMRSRRELGGGLPAGAAGLDAGRQG